MQKTLASIEREAGESRVSGPDRRLGHALEARSSDALTHGTE